MGFKERLLGKKGKNNPASEFDTIRRIAKKSAEIWHDKKGDNTKRKRFKEAADLLVGQLTPQILGDPKFYQNTAPGTHLRSLQLLSSLVPADDPEKLSDFLQGDTSQTIVAYMRGIVTHHVVIDYPKNPPTPPAEITTYEAEFAFRNNVARRLGTFGGFPQEYLRAVGREAGFLPPPVYEAAQDALRQRISPEN